MSQVRRYASTVEVAEYLKVTERTVRKYIAQGRLPAYRVGPHLVRVDLNDVDAMTRRIPTAGGDAA